MTECHACEEQSNELRERRGKYLCVRCSEEFDNLMEQKRQGRIVDLVGGLDDD